MSSLTLPIQLSLHPLPHLLGGFWEKASFLSFTVYGLSQALGTPTGFPNLSMLTPGVLLKVAWGSSPFKVTWKWHWERDEPLTEFCPRKARPERQALPPQPGSFTPGKGPKWERGRVEWADSDQDFVASLPEFDFSPMCMLLELSLYTCEMGTMTSVLTIIG